MFTHRVAARIPLVCTAILLASCGGGGGDGSPTGPGGGTPRVVSVAISPSTPSLQVGQQVQLTANVTVQNGAARTVTWSTSNAGIAAVSSAGVVSGVAVGSATITATSTVDAAVQGTATVVVVPVGAFPATANVTATTGSSFAPPVVDIASGGTVTWTFESLTHNVTFSGSNAPTGIGNSTNTSASRTFTQAGSFDYQCTLHPGMTGRVVVH